ncbi:MAG: hypothetical protein ACR2KE_07705 [Candidatus Nanopelagicales bacterium]
MRVRALALVAVLGIAALVAPGAAQAKAPPTKNLTFTARFTSLGTTLTTLPGGHTYGWNHLTGPTTWGKKKATMDFLGSVNYVDGTGPFGGLITVTRSDGTQLGFSVSGWATTPSNETGTADATFAGTVIVIGGTGPYEGATGTGTMSGFRKAALGSPVELTFSLTVQP